MVMLHNFYNSIFKRVLVSKHGQGLGVTGKLLCVKLLFPTEYLTLGIQFQYKGPFIYHLKKQLLSRTGFWKAKNVNIEYGCIDFRWFNVFLIL